MGRPRTTHCPKGHLKAGDNLYIDPRGWHVCRTCLRDADKRHRVVHAKPKKERQPAEARFWPKVAKGDGCWEWKAGTSAGGYGRFYDGTRNVAAHRFSYELANGSIPDGLQLDHLCRNRACVNPDHLEPVTASQNLLRGETVAAQNAAKTHCAHGHEFTPENTYHTANGRRLCKTCSKERNDRTAEYRRAYYKARNAAP